VVLPITCRVIDDRRAVLNPRAVTQDDLMAMIPFARLCGVTLAQATAEKVVGRLRWRPELCTGDGVMHGGAVMSLADTVGAVCAFLNLPAGASTTTIESKTNFFRAVRAGVVEATAQPLHVGRSTIVVQSDLRDGEGRRVALVTQTQAVREQAVKDQAAQERAEPARAVRPAP
jgi:1,4-dihydroxy-2-naphthoyl-CoA hydrolase